MPLCSMLFPESTTATNNEVDPEILFRQKQFATACHTSRMALQGDPSTNKNYRNNPSLLIQYTVPTAIDDTTKSNPSNEGNNNTTAHCGWRRRNVVIDVGKTFRETALRWMPRHNVRSLDAVLLTHHHMDAVAGLDDLRGFQVSTRAAAPLTSDTTKQRDESLVGKALGPPVRAPIPVYLSQECLNQVAQQFPWLFPKQQRVHQVSKSLEPEKETTAPSTTRTAVKRDVAALDITIIRDLEPFQVLQELTIVPLPVWHGEDLICLGYAFSLPTSPSLSKANGGTNTATVTKTTNIIYLSDISRMKDETLEYIQTQLPPTDIFIVDALLKGDTLHPVHFNLNQAVALAKQIGAKRTYLVGMSCDSFLPHDEMNAYLKQEMDIEISLAHDGLVLDL